MCDLIDHCSANFHSYFNGNPRMFEFEDCIDELKADWF